MSLSPQQFQQLPMFMSGREITEQTNPGDFEGGSRSLTAFWAGKRRGAEQRYAVKNSGPGTPSLADSIRSGGVQRPVELGWASSQRKPELANGHHRVAVSMATDPDRLIPVAHDAGTTPWVDTMRAFGWKT